MRAHGPFAFLFCVLFLVSCQTAPQGPMAPQDFKVNASKTRTKEAIITTFMRENYQIVRDSEFQLILDRPANDNFAAMVFFGSKFNRVPSARVIFTLTGNNPTNVMTRLQLVANPGSGFEQAMSLDGNADVRASLGMAMEKVKAQAE